MIAVDWGTSSFRAYRMEAASGAIAARIETGQGILAVPEGGFPAVLEAAIAPWLAAGERLVLLCGMVGSRQGWVEAPYLPCPAGAAEIAGALTAIAFRPGLRCLLIPGLRAADASGVPDVMRGEETKLLGLLSALEGTAALACLPGTHTKWARIEGGRIIGFATQMTGELRATLLAHSILGRMAEPEGEGSDDVFLRGVRRARETGGLLHHLFGTRALGLLGGLAEAETGAYLSGLLIGHEVAAVQAEGGVVPMRGPVHLIGSATLCRRYALALEAFAIPYRLHEADLVLRGMAQIAGTLPPA